MYFNKRLLLYTLIIVFLCCCNKEKGNDGLIYIEPPVPNRTFLALSMWDLSGTPLSFPESSLVDDLAYGYNRAKICWYSIDPLFQSNSSLLPAHISVTDMSHDYARQVLEMEVIPGNEIPSGTPRILMILNIGFYPSEAGPYNFDTEPGNYSSGIDENAKLKDPESRWGGIFSKQNYIDHDINYIEFWLMDPFIDNENISGDVFINIGSFSEDILQDNHPQNEASLSQIPDENDTCRWGLYGKILPLANSFSDIDSQDVGMDGLNNTQERIFYTDFLTMVNQICSPDAYQTILSDPSKDDYHHYRGSDYDALGVSIIDRYADYNGFEGNTTQNFNTVESYSTRRTLLPDNEDMNMDGSLNTATNYYEYHIQLNNSSLVQGTNYIDSIQRAYVHTIDHSTHILDWYHFKIPIQDYTSVYGNIQSPADFDMIRIYLSGFTEPVILRLAEFYITE